MYYFLLKTAVSGLLIQKLATAYREKQSRQALSIELTPILGEKDRLD